ncbi:hypothetical protein MKX08_000744 [Trichoderma sp. CBMAI-0020]|nr:hypothetical protein MKX08_000744 [Trichoderma sp. CBMAI-0020]
MSELFNNNDLALSIKIIHSNSIHILSTQMQDQANRTFMRSCTDIRSNKMGSSGCQLIDDDLQDHNLRPTGK